MFYQTESADAVIPKGTTVTFGESYKEYDHLVDVVSNAQKLADLLKTPDLSDENVDLINALITGELATLVDCGCDDEVDFTGMSIEEMIDVLG